MGLFHGWRHCPRCCSELEAGDGRVDCPVCGFTAYANPAPTACAVCTDGDRVLLVRRAGEPYRGFWDLPGGFVNEDEHPLECIRRELFEETGLEVEPEAFLGVWVDRYSEDDSGPATLNLYWIARVVGGEPRAADDVTELRWFGRDELPAELAFHIGDVLSAWKQQA